MLVVSWWLGPVGAMVEIPAPQDPMEATPTLLGGVHTSLSGVVTVDRLAQLRTWPMAWPYLTEDEQTYLQLVGDGLVPGPLRLIDPWRRNRLPQRVASGGSLYRSAGDFTQTGGSDPEWTPVTDPPPGVAVRGAVSWQRGSTAAGELATARVADRVPLLPGEEIRVSMWVRGATIQAAAAVDAYNAADAAARTTGTPVALSTTDWTQVSATYTTTGRITARPVLTVASGQAASTLQATGWMWSRSDRPTEWTPGGGAPTVVAGELGDTYNLFNNPRHSFTMTLRESLV